MKPAEELAAGLSLLQLPTDIALVERLLAFTNELERWNRVFNLTQIIGDKVISHHLLDSLSISKYVEGTDVIDVGSGGGLPGIALAICFPDLHVTLLDSNGKKTRFLEQARISLKLANVSVVQGRAESFVGQFDTIACRAFASLADISALTAHLLKPDGRVLAMKGALSTEERHEDVSPLVIDNIVSLDVPGIDAERHLVLMKF